MDTTFAVLLFRPAEIADRALSRGFAVALAGWDVPAPRLGIAAVPGVAGLSAAFYTSGLGQGEDELEHVVALFEDELSPAVAVLDAAAELGTAGATVLTLVHAEDVIHDEAWRLTAKSFERHFVREGDEGIEAGAETPEGSEITLVPVEVPAGASEAEERAIVERAVRPHRGSTFLSAAIGLPALPALMGALYAVERHLAVRLVEPDPASIAAETHLLDRVLGRVPGRGASTGPEAVAGVAQPAQHAAFAAAYDWEDPADPHDAYRELSIGAVEGTLRFLRAAEISALAKDPGWVAIGGPSGLYPVAKILGSALGGGGEGATLALASDGERLVLVRPGGLLRAAGPTFGELIRYLSLGWSRRSEAEEDLIGALMLRARLRSEAEVR
jgi:hypothetical protein